MDRADGPDLIWCFIFKKEVDDILVFVDVKNGKEILKVGTGNTDDYYPYCVLEYTPENLSCNR